MFGSRSCGNFAIPLSDDIIKVLYKKCKGKRNRIGLIEDNIKNIFATNNYHLDYDYIGEVHMSGKNNYAKSSQDKRFNSFDKDLMVFPFRADKIKKFVEDTNRNYLTKEDVPVPPPNPAVINTKSVPIKCSRKSSSDSIAAFLPTSGSAPAPKPRVKRAPI